MNKEQYVAEAVETARANCVGSRARAMFSADKVAASAAAAWDANNTPEALQKAMLISALTARGGKVWEGKRVYFNNVKVGEVGRTISCYVELSTREVCGTRTAEERAAAAAVIGF